MKVRFGEFTWDREAGRLLGPEGEVRLRPQAFRMLEVLVESAPRILSQEELLDQVWGVEHLSPASVKQAVSEVRLALCDDPTRPRIIETVHRRGYRFIAALEPVVESEAAARDVGPEPTVVDLVTAEEEAAAQDGEGATREAPEAATAELLAPPLPEVRPARRRRLSVLGLGLVAVVAVIVGIFLLRERGPLRTANSRLGASEGSSEEGGVLGRPTVAILGFRNLSAHPEDAWVSTALGEILGFELTAQGRLRLIPVENVVRMQSELGGRDEGATSADLARIGRYLGTHWVIAGSYLVSPAPKDSTAGAVDGARLRLQVMVQDVRTGETVAWARQTGTRGELLELATAAARGILGSLASQGVGKPEGAEVTKGAATTAASLAANGESLRLWSEAMSRLRVRDAAAAVALLLQAQATDPKNPFVHDALAVAWSRLGFDGRAAASAGQALALSAGLPEEVRSVLAARAHEMRFELDEALKIYAELWQRYSDNLDYGLNFAAAQRQSGAPEASFATVEAMRKLPAPDGLDPRIDLAESNAAWGVGDFVRCRDAGSKAIEKAQARGATLLVAAGKVTRGWAFVRLGENGSARADFQSAAALYHRAGDRGAVASARAAEALVLQTLGQVQEARRNYEEAIRVFSELGDRTREAKSLNNLAALVGEGDLARTEQLLLRSLAIKREIDDQQGAALTLANLGSVRGMRADLAGARTYLDQALGISRRLGDAHSTALALRGLAEIEAQQGRFAAGRAALEEALGLSRQNGDANGAARAQLIRGELEHKAGRRAESRRRFDVALTDFQKFDDEECIAIATLGLADLDFEEGALDRASRRYQAALPFALEREDRGQEASARFGLAQVAARRGDTAAARAEYEKALALWTEVHDPKQVEAVRTALAKLAR